MKCERNELSHESVRTQSNTQKVDEKILVT
jgi:hypothetical protein